MTENAEPAPEPDIVPELRRLADELARTWKADAAEIVAMRKAATAIEYLRDANLLHIADENTIKELRAELRAARGEEGR